MAHHRAPNTRGLYERINIACAKGSCGQNVSVRVVECIDGHRNRPASIAEVVHIYPATRLKEQIAQLVSEATPATFSLDEEDFYLRGSRLFFSASMGKIVYAFDDIPELARLAPYAATPAQERRIRESLKDFKEKCRQMSTENCADCVVNRRHPKCMLRLFGLVDDEYTPRPHHGHEYGDYSRTVTMDGDANAQLVVAMKAARPMAKTLSHRDSIGQDIVSQVSTYRHDGTMDLIAVCVPRKLNDRFKAILRVDAKDSGKKLLFMDDDVLVRLIHSALEKNGMRLRDV